MRNENMSVGHGHGIDPRVPDPPKSLPEILADAALIVPHLGVLLFRLLRDPRVSRQRNPDAEDRRSIAAIAVRAGVFVAS